MPIDPGDRATLARDIVELLSKAIAAGIDKIDSDRRLLQEKVMGEVMTMVAEKTITSYELGSRLYPKYPNLLSKDLWNIMSSLKTMKFCTIEDNGDDGFTLTHIPQR